MIRLIIGSITVFLYLLLTLPMLLTLWIMGFVNKGLKDRISHAMIKWAFKLLLFVCGVRYDAYGTENIPDDRSVLFVGNHRSIFDILLMYVHTKMPTGIIAKKEMRKIPVFNIWMGNIGCLFLDRDDIKQGLKTILAAIDMVKNGMCMAIFPEGTRNKVEGTFLPFKAGSFKIAEKSKCDVIPFAVIGAAAAFEDHKPYVKKSHVIICFGGPIRTADLSKDELKVIHETARNEVMRMYEENKDKI